MNAARDETFDLTIKVRVTTMNGWEPDRTDIESWLDGGSVLELIAIENLKLVEQT
jgi:hypothetical protein